MVMGRLTGDEGMPAGRQVEPFHRTELREDLQRAEDGRAAQAVATAVGIGEQLVRREVAASRGNEARKRATRRRQPIAGVFEGFNDRFRGNHPAMLAVIETESQ